MTIVKLARRLGILSNSFLVGDLTMSLNLISGVAHVDKFYSEFFDKPRSSEARHAFENFEEFYQHLVNNTQSTLSKLNVKTLDFLLESVALTDDDTVQLLEQRILTELIKHKY